MKISTVGFRGWALASGVFLSAFLGGAAAAAAIAPVWKMALLAGSAGLATLLHVAIGGLRNRRQLITWIAPLAAMPTLVIVAGVWIDRWRAGLGEAMMLAATAILVWLAGMAAWRWFDFAKHARAPGQQLGRVYGGVRALRDRWLWPMMVLSLVVLLLALFNQSKSFAPDAAVTSWILDDAGLYVVLLALGAIVSHLVAVGLVQSGSAAIPLEAGNAERDRRLILRFGGRALAALGLGLALIVFWYAQSGRASAAQPQAGKAIGFFDLVTWLGTFATFVVVVATALVGMYIKRRDDESQHSSAITEMRQRWIDTLRINLSKVVAAGQGLRAAALAGQPDQALARDAIRRLNQIAFQLNPTEGHHVVLLNALRAWLHAADLHAQLKGDAPAPPVVNNAEFDLVQHWLVALGQLVLKIEWVVTSLDAKRIESKVGRLWDDLQRFEREHASELKELASVAWDQRQTLASKLLQGANVERS